ncbi:MULTISPECIES: hypothetical protein [Bacillus cereus group]|uniref:Uncharacterized protein n=1 Tax=Bacillus cereus TaxID=1396 RepID=A0A9X6W2R2_BACCE|nr:MULTISPECIES: hypothetical protein [Bacillus cereus group]PFF51888.1 hypothetical protein CN357_04135 [Bacillus cereus]PGB13143.1 hypothetical protein COM09_15410 [Bacillus toyonensis]SME49715.1 hypothetical protein BACERE00183_04332 [Bacillus cereus]
MNTTLNEKGMELVKYKNELDKASNNSIAKEAIIDLVKKKFSSTEASLIIHSNSAYSLIEQLANDKRYALSKERIVQENLNKIIASVKKHAQPQRKLWQKASKVYNLKFAVAEDSDTETYAVIKHIGLGKEFLKNYFNVTDGRTAKSLMKKDGFLDKYVSMRLPFVIEKVLDGIHENHKERLNIIVSDSYFAEKTQLYNVDVRLEFNMNSDMDEAGRNIAHILRCLENGVKLKEI